VDAIFHQRRGRLELDFEAKRARDLRPAAWSFDGAESVQRQPDGSLHVRSGAIQLRLDAPRAFQRGRAIPASYRIRDGTISVALGPHDPNLPLRIDPITDVISFAGGSGADEIHAATIDASGNVYLAGETASSNFFTSTSSQARAGTDAFLTKMDPTGTQILFTTYVSGSGRDAFHALAVDSFGAIYLTGRTASPNFPATSGSVQPIHGGSEDAFAVRLTPGGTISWASYLGGSGTDAGLAIGVDFAGAVYIAGQTSSTNLPAAGNPVQATNRGGASDCFIAKFNPTGTALSYLTYYGGSGLDACYGLYVSPDGWSYATGMTESPNLTLAAAYQSQLKGTSDAFVLQLNPSGSTLGMATYLGGSAQESANAIIHDGTGLVVAGQTYSPDFPITAGAMQSSLRGISDGFIAYLNQNLVGLRRATFLGGSQADSITALAPGFEGSVLAAGFTASADFPQRNPLQSTFGGVLDAFVTLLDASGQMTFSSGLGGSDDDRAAAVRAKPTGGFLLAGSTLSSNFPVSLSAPQPRYGGSGEGWYLLSGQNAAPQVTSLTPVQAAGPAQTFTLDITDADGENDLTSVNLLIAPQLNPVSACSVLFDPAATVFRLVGNDGAVVAGTVAPGSGSASNSQCNLLGSGSSVLRSGNLLRLTIQLQFNQSFAGVKKLLVYASDRQAANTGWVEAGSYNVFFNVAPGPVTVSPANGSTPAQFFTVTASDLNGNADLAQVRLLISTAPTPDTGCSVLYDGLTHTLSLNSGPGAPPGAANDLASTECVLVTRQATVARNGNNLTVTLPLQFLFRGTRWVYAQSVDRSGLESGWRQTGTWTLPNNFAPQAGYVSPASGTAPWQLFTIVTSDPDGAADIAAIRFLMNTAISHSGACAVDYVAASNSFALLNDAGQVAGWVTPGSNQLAANARCALLGNQSVAIRNGNLLSVNLSLQLLAASQGPRSIYVQAEDRAGNVDPWKPLGSWNLPGSNTAPTLMSVSPASGSGDAPTFTVTAGDANGAGDVRTVQFLISSSGEAARNCLLHYSRADNRLYVGNDATGALSVSQSVTPGTGSAANSQCSVTGAGFSSTQSGGIVTLNIPVRFAANYRGARNLLAWADDNAGAASGWRTMGQWTLLDGTKPVVALAPVSGSARQADFTVTATDPDGAANIRQVRLLIGPSLSTANACVLTFDQPSRGFSLAANSGAGNAGFLLPGQPASIANSQCSLFGPASAMLRSGNHLTVRFSVTFLPSWRGAMKVYTQATDHQGQVTGWTEAGSWTLN
jgi:hypothetical protein